METKKLTIIIARNAVGRFNYISDKYTEFDVNECQLMTLLGGMFGVTVTSPKNKSYSFKIEISKIESE